VIPLPPGCLTRCVDPSGGACPLHDAAAEVQLQDCFAFHTSQNHRTLTAQEEAIWPIVFALALKTSIFPPYPCTLFLFEESSNTLTASIEPASITLQAEHSRPETYHIWLICKSLLPHSWPFYEQEQFVPVYSVQLHHDFEHLCQISSPHLPNLPSSLKFLITQ